MISLRILLHTGMGNKERSEGMGELGMDNLPDIAPTTHRRSWHLLSARIRGHSKMGGESQPNPPVQNPPRLPQS